MTSKPSKTSPKQTTPVTRTKIARSTAAAMVDRSPLPTDELSSGVGMRLRYLREAYGLSQRELARRAGLNHGTIGCIEKETISPSVGSLRRILDSFPMTLSDFFALDPESERQIFFRHSELLEVGANGVSLKQVGHNLKGRPLQILLEHYVPGAETAPKPYAHAGDEGGVVVKGKIEITVGGVSQVLEQGDGYLFPSHLPHRFRNVGDDDCVIVSAVTPPV